MVEIADRAFAGDLPEEAQPPSAVTEPDEEDEGDVCRICRNRGDEDHPLRYPCDCSGSIKFVHQDCLLQWLDHSNSRQCEVCKHAFSFSPVYADNAPSRLPFQELIIGVGMKACHIFQFILRLAFVLSVWLMIIPFITYWIWRLTFVRSLGEAQRLFLSHITAQLILRDCLHGFLLSAIVVLIFLGATSLRDYIRHLRELGAHDAKRDDGGRERNGARAVRRLPGPNNRVPADGNIDELAEAQGFGAGELLRRNTKNVAARLERLEAQAEQMLDGLDVVDGADDVPFDELVGMQGPVFHLVENAITVLASNAIFLIVVIFVPFSLGRIVMFYLSCFSISQTEEVEISDDTGEKAEPSSSGITILAVILTCIIVSVVTFWLFMKLPEKPGRQAPSMHTAPTTLTSAIRPAAMDDPASPANGQLSPRTPQPFMEYVRTVDDTPYCKLDGRR